MMCMLSYFRWCGMCNKQIETKKYVSKNFVFSRSKHANYSSLKWHFGVQNPRIIYGKKTPV